MNITVRMEKSELLRVLAENQAKHIHDYNESVKGYNEALHLALRIEFSRVDRAICDGASKPIRNKLPHLPIPESHEQSYVVAIDAITRTVDSIIELNERDFNTLVRDDWEWKGAFTSTSGFYAKGGLPNAEA